jgi:hypothetical protein
MEHKTEWETLREIKQMMERSSRFISLSGWSGIAAGVCALVGAYFAHQVIVNNGGASLRMTGDLNTVISVKQFMGSRLFFIAIFTFVSAFATAFIFTYLKSKKKNVPIWGITSRRLMVNVAVPMIAGGFFLLRMIQVGFYGLVAPGCLIFYGLALVNASKYTLGEIRNLGYAQVVLGIINCWYMGYGIYFWAVGFGVLHIIYGILMWQKYERSETEGEKEIINA